MRELESRSPLDQATSLTYLDVAKATLVGPEALSQASIRLALHRLGVGRGDGVALAAYDPDQGALAHALWSRGVGFARLVGSWIQPAAGSESYLLVRADRALIERPFRRFGRPTFVFWRVGGGAVLLTRDGDEVLLPRVEPEDLARVLADAKGIKSLFFRFPPSSFVDGVIAAQFERTLREVGKRESPRVRGLGLGQRGTFS